jgi:hypothetical protein
MRRRTTLQWAFTVHEVLERDPEQRAGAHGQREGVADQVRVREAAEAVTLRSAERRREPEADDGEAGGLREHRAALRAEADAVGVPGGERLERRVVALGARGLLVGA